METVKSRRCYTSDCRLGLFHSHLWPTLVRACTLLKEGVPFTAKRAVSVLTFLKCHWFQNVKGETQRFPPDYKIKDLGLQCVYYILFIITVQK